MGTQGQMLFGRIDDMLARVTQGIDKAMKKQREKTAFQPSQRNRELAALHQSLLEETAHAYKRVLHLPEGTTADDVFNGDDNLEDAAMLISTTMENIGVMTQMSGACGLPPS